MKYTKQGVRDLSGIGPKKTVGIKLEEPPVHVTCFHKGTLVQHRSGYYSVCSVCGESGMLHASNLGADWLGDVRHRDPAVCAENLRMEKQRVERDRKPKLQTNSDGAGI